MLQLLCGARLITSLVQLLSILSKVLDVHFDCFLPTVLFCCCVFISAFHAFLLSLAFLTAVPEQYACILRCF